MRLRKDGARAGYVAVSMVDTLFDTPETTKYGKLDLAVDQIRQRFGEDAIMCSTFVGSKLDHMSGGIAKEKKIGIAYCEVIE